MTPTRGMLRPPGERALVPGVRKIAVVRANALGDLIFALPALEALRSAYPGAEIVLLADRWQRDFLEGRPGPVDRVVPLPAAEGVRSPRPGEREDARKLGEFFATMRKERFDIALQLHGGGRYSNPFTRRLGARVTAGLQADDAEPLDRNVPYVYYHHEVLRYLEAVSIVGATAAGLEPRVAVLASDVEEAERALPDARAPLAVLHPGATDGRRRWPPERFAAVADAIAREGALVAITGVEEEREVVESVAAAMDRPALALIGRLSLGGLAGLLSLATVVVSNDTGPLHLAAAVGTRTVGIFWCGNMLNGGPFTRLRHRPQISWLTECPVCGVDSTNDLWPTRTGVARCPHNPSFVTKVTLEQVREAALELYRGAEYGSRRGEERLTA